MHFTGVLWQAQNWGQGGRGLVSTLSTGKHPPGPLEWWCSAIHVPPPAVIRCLGQLLFSYWSSLPQPWLGTQLWPRQAMAGWVWIMDGWEWWVRVCSAGRWRWLGIMGSKPLTMLPFFLVINFGKSLKSPKCPTTLVGRFVTSTDCHYF